MTFKGPHGIHWFLKVYPSTHYEKNIKFRYIHPKIRQAEDQSSDFGNISRLKDSIEAYPAAKIKRTGRDEHRSELWRVNKRQERRRREEKGRNQHPPSNRESVGGRGKRVGPLPEKTSRQRERSRRRCVCHCRRCAPEREPIGPEWPLWNVEVIYEGSSSLQKFMILSPKKNRIFVLKAE